MKELSQLQNALLAIGALLMVVGTGLGVFSITLNISSAIFAVGAVLFACIQMQQRYLGSNLTIRRLRRIMVAGDLCFIIAALLMLEQHYQFLFPYFARTIEGYNNYVHYIYNNWVIPLLIGAVFELYSTHRIVSELNKEQQQGSNDN